MKFKIKFYPTILLLLAATILSVSFAIDCKNITRLPAQYSSGTRDINAVSSQGVIIDFKAIALESAKTYLTNEYNNKLMPSRPPGEVEAYETLQPNNFISDAEKPAKCRTQSGTRALP